MREKKTQHGKYPMVASDPDVHPTRTWHWRQICQVLDQCLPTFQCNVLKINHITCCCVCGEYQDTIYQQVSTCRRLAPQKRQLQRNDRGLHSIYIGQYVSNSTSLAKRIGKNRRQHLLYRMKML